MNFRFSLAGFRRFGLPSATLLAGLVLMAACGAAPSQARTLEVGADKEYKMPSEAAAKAQDGDRIAIAPGEYFDCAIWRNKNLTIEGTGPGATAVITDKVCQGKALFVVQGANVTIRNLTLQRARVPDMNGAGIRAEGRDMVVDHVRFINNQDGILSNSNLGGTLTVLDSEFDRNGVCSPTCAHAIYANQLDLLRIERSKFTNTRQGHHIKSRASRTEVLDSTIADGDEGTASYLIDIPNGGDLVVRGNTMQKGPMAENHSAAIVIGAEGVSNPTHEITIEGNSFRNTGSHETYFVRNLTATEAMLKGNKISGATKPLQGDGSVR